MTKYKFRYLEELWEQHGQKDPIEAQNNLFKNEIDFDIETIQKNYNKEKERIDKEMSFKNIDTEHMDVNEKRIFQKNLAMVNCRQDVNSLFKTMSFNHFDNASRFIKCRQLISQ